MKLDFFAPRVSADTKFFWDGCNEHKLLFQKCEECGTVRWPAAYLCPKCLSEKTKIIESSGKGSLYSFVVFHRAFHPSIEDKVPYVTAEVDLDEGVRLVTNISDSDGSDLKCGDKVSLVWEDCDGYSKPVFKREEL